MKVRVAQVQDSESIGKILRDGFINAFLGVHQNKDQDVYDYANSLTKEKIKEEIETESNVYFICEEESGSKKEEEEEKKEVLGVTRLVYGANEEGVPSSLNPVELNRIYCNSNRKRSGVGTALMQRCIQEAKLKGCDLIWLGVWEHNPSATSFYKKFGFQRCSEHVFWVGSDPQTDILMYLSLKTTTQALVPPFTAETAAQKVKKAQDLWNTRSPENVVKAYTQDTVWRNRDHFIKGSDQVKQFLHNKWQKEQGYRLRKELFTFADNKIAVQFWYEYYTNNDPSIYYRCYGLEHWTFNSDGLMMTRMMSGNELQITPKDRWFKDDVLDVNSIQLPDGHHSS